MNKKELVAAVAAESGVSARLAAGVVDVVLGVIEKALVGGEEVKLSSFGVFAVRSRAARVGTNPASGKRITIPASKTVVFKASKNLKSSVN